jgi:hypothetical protein
LEQACGELNLLLDLAHLKVSCRSLGLSLQREAAQLIELSDYLHVSENDGLADTNRGVTTPDSSVLEALDGKLGDKLVTCEVYSGLSDVAQTVRALRSLETGESMAQDERSCSGRWPSPNAFTPGATSQLRAVPDCPGSSGGCLPRTPAV